MTNVQNADNHKIDNFSYLNVKFHQLSMNHFLYGSVYKAVFSLKSWVDYLIFNK